VLAAPPKPVEGAWDAKGCETPAPNPGVGVPNVEGAVPYAPGDPKL